jgi:hypothetical protein
VVHQLFVSFLAQRKETLPTATFLDSSNHLHIYEFCLQPFNSSTQVRMSFPYPSTAIAGRESPPQSSPTILALKPCEYTRFMPGGFGSRLANARNLAPSQVFPLPTPRFISVLPDDGVSFIAERHSAISSDVASKIMPEHDTARGSYVSSYHNDGSISGDNRLPANSIPFTESWGGNGRAVRCPSESAPSEGSVESDQTVTQRVGRTISFGQFPPTMIPEKYRAPISVFSKSKVAPVVPQGVRSLWIISTCYVIND